MNDKKEIRLYIKNLKQSLSDQFKCDCAEIVFGHLFQLKEWHKAKNVLFYHSLPDELQTVKYLKLVADKNLFLPRVNGDILEIVKYDGDSLEIGYYDILEPTSHQIVPPESMDLIIVPGIAFDKCGNRLGRGKGFYDRLLVNTNAVKIGVGYDFQLLSSIPHDYHDIKMDIIITPNNLIKTTVADDDNKQTY